MVAHFSKLLATDCGAIAVQHRSKQTARLLARESPATDGPSMWRCSSAATVCGVIAVQSADYSSM